ncbi:hypothetical protein BK120_33670 [Paenibacillus sp. FSL A5-0031]|uniref:hypothetical protein n=1 Tax=Paenibacillus sp. FSL A5-0031 TaxID=1920420 RepID=UPI00096FD935|nr:hypothetical protein [Paenibacillus sp. FSL A5-0031]OME70106.1 hypothetical protein BK120_33670 [Paenibacillus sp. FSL A5-0031]
MEPFDYEKAISLIKAPFPSGTVKLRRDNNRAYIPNQVYTDRIETATASQWSQEIRDVEINVPHGYVKIIARVTIGEHYRDGIGFSEVEKDQHGNGKNIANKVDLAYTEAVREALDTWQIGWKDLAPYHTKDEDWGSNPALRHLLANAPGAGIENQVIQSRDMVTHNCIFSGCGKQLSRDEWDFLGLIPALNREKMVYCFLHIPNHMKKKAPSDIIEKYEARIQQGQ